MEVLLNEVDEADNSENEDDDDDDDDDDADDRSLFDNLLSMAIVLHVLIVGGRQASIEKGCEILWGMETNHTPFGL